MIDLELSKGELALAFVVNLHKIAYYVLLTLAGVPDNISIFIVGFHYIQSVIHTMSVWELQDRIKQVKTSTEDNYARIDSLNEDLEKLTKEVDSGFSHYENQVDNLNWKLRK